MIEIVYQREVEYPLGRTLSQYFDLEHLEHVHPRSVGRARLISQHQDTVIWDLEWPPLLGFLRLRNRVTQRFLPPNRIHALVSTGFFRGTNIDIELSQTPRGTLIIELCITNRHSAHKKEGRSDPVMNERMRSGRLRTSVVIRQSVVMRSSRLSGRPLASVALKWVQTNSSGLSSGA